MLTVVRHPDPHGPVGADRPHGGRETAPAAAGVRLALRVVGGVAAAAARGLRLVARARAGSACCCSYAIAPRRHRHRLGGEPAVAARHAWRSRSASAPRRPRRSPSWARRRVALPVRRADGARRTRHRRAARRPRAATAAPGCRPGPCATARAGAGTAGGRVARGRAAHRCRHPAVPAPARRARAWSRWSCSSSASPSGAPRRISRATCRATAEVAAHMLTAEHRRAEPTDAALAQVEKLLPGIGSLSAVTVEKGGPADKRTLAELNLRGLTGATDRRREPRRSPAHLSVGPGAAGGGRCARAERHDRRRSPRRPNASADQGPLTGENDGASAEFRRTGHELVDWMADYLRDVERLPVTPDVKPGDIRRALPASPPDAAEPSAQLMNDFGRIILPGMTHWGHPGFFAYFPSSASPPSMLAEMLTATIGAQCMSWQTSPAATELEQVTMDWLRQMLGLPGGLHRRHPGHVIHRHARGAPHRPRARHRALPRRSTGCRMCRAGSPSTPRANGTPRWTRRCGSPGYGIESLRLIDLDEDFAMRPDVLAAAIAADVASGFVPAAVVATTGTTGTTAIDPAAGHRRGLPAPRRLAPHRRLVRRHRGDPSREALDHRRRGAGRQLRVQSPQVDAGQLRLLGVLREGRGRAAPHLLREPRVPPHRARRRGRQLPRLGHPARPPVPGAQALVGHQELRRRGDPGDHPPALRLGAAGGRLDPGRRPVRAAGAGAAGAGLLPAPSARRARTSPPSTSGTANCWPG